MLFEIAQQLDAAIKAKGFRTPVIYTERGERASAAEDRIVVGHERSGGVERFGAVIGPGGNPRAVMTRVCAGVIRMYGQSTLPGAAIQDHERHVDQEMVDPVLCELWKILRRRRQIDPIGEWTGGFIEPEWMKGTEVWPGAVYELRFTVPRAVLDRTWEGVGRPTVTVGGVANMTSVEGNETACGA